MTQPADAAARISEIVQANRIDLSSEKVAQAAIGDLLTGDSITFTREMRLSPGDIPDFFLPDSGLAIEVKLRSTSKMNIYRQLRRYAEDDRVKGLLLVTNTAMDLPQEIEGKPAWRVSLGQAWL